MEALNHPPETPMTLERSFDLLGIKEIPGVKKEDREYYLSVKNIFLGALEMTEQRDGVDWIRQNREIMLNRWESFLEMNLL
jgi:hypothetical protein